MNWTISAAPLIDEIHEISFVPLCRRCVGMWLFSPHVAVSWAPSSCVEARPVILYQCEGVVCSVESFAPLFWILARRQD